MDKTDIILEGRDIVKIYGGVEALNNVTFKLPRNEVVALLGDNGAGKSTRIKILSGAISSTSGQIFLDGEKIELNGTKQAKDLGIETVYQDLALVDCLSIEENIYLGKEIVKKYLGIEVLQNKEMKKGSLKFLKDVGIDFILPSGGYFVVAKINRKHFEMAGIDIDQKVNKDALHKYLCNDAYQSLTSTILGAWTIWCHGQFGVVFNLGLLVSGNSFWYTVFGFPMVPACQKISCGGSHLGQSGHQHTV